MNSARALDSWRSLARTAAGRRLFSRLVCLKAPRLGSIRPVFEVLEPGRAVARIGRRRAVTNHLGTVHAIAMTNLCELAAGTVTEVSIPASMRWIPRGMRIEYVGKAETDVRAEAILPGLAESGSRDVVVPVDVLDAGGRRVVRADITM